ncbi:MAG: hypothetical protein V2I54_10545 [Bacteroidales bacterium]|nr:hypothetical protein [Bacteroidales bacterium]
MKQISLFLIIFFIFFQNSISQEKNCDINTQFTQNAQFLFNSFQKGTVVFENNTQTSALLNFNVVSNNIYYVENEKFYVLNPESVDYVSICNKKFYSYNNKVYELIYNKKFQLLAGREVNWEELQGREGAYGAKSPNTVGSNLSTIDVTNISEDHSYLVNLRDNEEDKEITLSLIFKIKYGNNFYSTSKRSFYKIYPDHKKEIKQYIKDNNLNLNQKSDLIKLANYCDEL